MLVELGIFIAVYAVYLAAIMVAVMLAYAIVIAAGMSVIGIYRFARYADVRSEVLFILGTMLRRLRHRLAQLGKWCAYSGVVIKTQFVRAATFPVRALRPKNKPSKNQPTIAQRVAAAKAADAAAKATAAGLDGSVWVSA